MTSIEFYHNAADKVAAASRLVADFYASKRRVLVYAPDPQVAARLDRMLWVQPAISFVPHVPVGSRLEQRTPVVIGASLDVAGHDDVLLNLGDELPPGFSRFERLIEVVGTDEGDRQPARARYKFYRDRGYPLATHDFNSIR